MENLVEDAPLEELQERFKFLGQLNQYHSSVEDEVCFVPVCLLSSSVLCMCVFER